MKICKIQEKCGGCKNLKMPYDEQLKKKTIYIKKILNYKNTKNTIGMDNPYNYRNKGKYALKNGKMGFFEEGSHKIVYSKCLIQNEVINNVAEDINRLVQKYKISIYNEDNGKGFLRHVVIRYGINTDEIMIIFVTTEGKMYRRNEIIKEITEKYTNIKSIVQNINVKNTNAILGNKIYILFGNDYIYDKIEDLKFKISPLSFYQVNPIQMEKLYKTAIELANITKNDIVYDLYSGIGTISLCVSKKVKKVYGIEIVNDAVKDAIYNAKINNVNNTEFISGKVEELLPKLCLKQKADVVFVDPPRIGLDKKTIETLFKIKSKKIVYISCNPLTLAENLKELEKMYEIKEVQPVDMFPFTDHCEVITCLNLKK